jgi:4-hydroxy-3-polyprenylbenzoate decarboxylase
MSWQTDKVPEGPISEYAGYQIPGANSPKPLLTITAITHRRDPILPIAVAGPPVEEGHTAWGIPHAAQTLHDLREHDIPVSGVWLLFKALTTGWQLPLSPPGAGLIESATIRRTNCAAGSEELSWRQRVEWISPRFW